MVNAKTTEADAALLRYLKALRQGRGLSGRQSHPPLPLDVARVLNINTRLSHDERLAEVMTKVARSLRQLDRTDREQAHYARMAFNLTGTATNWLARVQSHAESSGRSRRTIIRKVDAALLLLTVTMTAAASDVRDEPHETVALARLKDILARKKEIRIVRFSVSIRVFSDHVEVHETVEVESQAPAAEFYVIGKTLPYPTSRVTTTVLEGAEMLAVEQPNEHWLLELLAFPQPLSQGTRHRFAVLHDARGMAPMWTATTMHDADAVRVNVSYVDKVKRPVWLIDSFPPKLLNGNSIDAIVREHATELPVDRLGGASHTFVDLQPEKSYGLAWIDLSSDNSSDDE